MSVVCCHAEISTTGRSLVQGCPSECGEPECDRRTSQRKLRPTRAVEPQEEEGERERVGGK